MYVDLGLFSHCSYRAKKKLWKLNATFEWTNCGDRLGRRVEWENKIVAVQADIFIIKKCSFLIDFGSKQCGV